MRTILRHPRGAILSILYSLRHCPERAFTIPIVCGGKARIKKHATARLSLSRRLFLGYFFTRVGEIGQIDHDFTILQLAARSRFEAGDKAVIGPGVRVIIGPEARVAVGNQTFISATSLLVAQSEIVIGDSCAISWGVQILDSDFHSTSSNAPSAPIRIGNHVWIGSRASIQKGVTIGDGAIVASGAIVTRDVPAKTLVAGVPARIVRTEVSWSL